MNLILLLIIAGLIYIIYQKNNGNSWKKSFGLIFILIALILLNPIPDPSDAVIFPIYSSVRGLGVSADTFAINFLNYLIVTTLIAIGLLLVGMNLLGISFNQIKKKLDLGKYKLALFIGVLVVALIAFLDIQGLIFFTDLGRDYLVGDFPHSYWLAFRNTAYILMGLVAFCYYHFAHQDLSETLAVFLTPFILFWTGLADILFFIFRKVPIPKELPWLNTHPIIGWISSNLGFETVTNLSLIFNVIIGFILVFLITFLLKEKF